MEELIGIIIVIAVIIKIIIAITQTTIEFIVEYWQYFLIGYAVIGVLAVLVFYESGISKFNLNNKKNKDKKFIKSTFSDFMNIASYSYESFTSAIETLHPVYKVIFTLLMIAPFIALFVFHLIIAMLVYLIKYITYIIAKLFDDIYLNRHIMICPECYSNYDLPNYRCKNCGEIHSNLKPSLNYGIFYHKCKCGNNLSVFRNSRSEMEAICSNMYCNKKLPKEININIEKKVITILGGDDNSKNIILNKTIQFLENNFKNIDFINKDDELTNILIRKNFKKSLFYLYKSTNDDLLDIDRMIEKDIYSYAGGIIFAIDLSSFKKINKKYIGIKAEDIILRFKEVLSSKGKISLKNKYKNPVVFIFYNNGLINKDIDKETLKELDEKYLLQLIETEFANYQFITIHQNSQLNINWLFKKVKKLVSSVDKKLKYKIFAIISTILLIVGSGYYYKNNIFSTFNKEKSEYTKNSNKVNNTISSSNLNDKKLQETSLSKNQKQYEYIKTNYPTSYNILNQWNKANNNYDYNTLSKLYASNIIYYGHYNTKYYVLRDKQRFFNRYPYFSQYIKNISLQKIDGYRYVIKFDKYVKKNTNATPKLYPSYIIIKKDINNEWKIFEEGDTITDKYIGRLNKKTVDTKKILKHGNYKVKNRYISLKIKWEQTGNWINFNINAKNLYKTLKGGISVSFPNIKKLSTVSIKNFPDTKIIKNISLKNNIGMNSFKAYPSGSKIWSKYLQSSMNAHYLLIEGWSNNWKKNTIKSIQFKVNIKNLHNLKINIRAILKSDKTEYILPQKGKTDQQGYPIKQLVINLNKPTSKILKKPINLKKISKKSYKIYIVKPGDTLTKIAKDMYGDPTKYKLIRFANKLSSNSLKVDMKLIIPLKKNNKKNQNYNKLSKSTKSNIKKIKWITPTKKACYKGGGEFYKFGCRAYWKDAKTICHISGGRLPYMAELVTVITDCGAKISSSKRQLNKNKKNLNYQSCYKRKGFNPVFYWSSLLTNSKNGAWFTSFYDAGMKIADLNYINNKFYIKCVKINK